MAKERGTPNRPRLAVGPPGGAAEVGAVKDDLVDTLTLWEFPPEDFPRWRREFSDAVDSYEADRRWLGEREREAERMGAHAVRVPLTIAEMRAELAAVGAPNPPENRAAVLGLVAASRRMKDLRSR